MSAFHISLSEGDRFYQKVFDFVIPVEKIANPNLENLARLDRLDLRFAFTKIALWAREQFRRIVYIDADVVALRAPDELFELDCPFAAAPDIGWPDIFNSGVMVLTPNEAEYRSLRTLAASGSSFDGADQGLLNEYYSNNRWHRLSFAYNCTPSSSYQYEPAYRHFRSNISLIHFIGKQKPWQQGRRAMSSAASGVYKELVGSWWSVYDRHYKAGHTSALGQISTADHHLQAFVYDEDSHSAMPLAGATTLPDVTYTNQASSIDRTRTEVPLTEPDDAAASLATHPPLAIQQRQKEPPQMAWDATRSAPPTGSKAEAGEFPSQRYEMSSSTGLFQAPTSYPEPPKDMYYQVPPRPELVQKPIPIFPWEQQAKRPTRVFAEPSRSLPAVATEFMTTRAASAGTDDTPELPGSTSIDKAIAPAEVLDSFSRINAWDNVSSIDHYVRAVRESQTKRAALQALQDDRYKTGSGLGKVDAPEGKSRRAPRQESLILTDFPTEVERPSLPVTPAPVRRPMFWGEERDEQGELPAAEGVPNQSEWDPHERLEQLRRTSVAAAEELPKHTPVKEAPLRAVPETSSDLIRSSTGTVVSPSESKNMQDQKGSKTSVYARDAVLE